jgi:lipoprotein-releasing system permease protein
LAALVGAKDVGRVTLFHSDYYLQQIPIRVGLSETYGIALGSFLVSALASYLPARRAGRLKPLEVIRKAS